MTTHYVMVHCHNTTPQGDALRLFRVSAYASSGNKEELPYNFHHLVGVCKIILAGRNRKGQEFLPDLDLCGTQLLIELP